MGNLTKREIQVLKYLAKGLTNDAIGESLCISKDTVKMYLKRIFGKLGVQNRVSAVVKGITSGLIIADEVSK